MKTEESECMLCQPGYGLKKFVRRKIERDYFYSSLDYKNSTDSKYRENEKSTVKPVLCFFMRS